MLRASSAATLAMRVRRMSTAKAVEIFSASGASESLRSFVQGRLKRRAKRRFRAGQSSKQAPEGTEQLNSARLMLNHMIEESKQKLDLEQVKCSEFQNKHGEQMEESRQDVAMYNGLSARARALVLSAQADMERFNSKLPQLEHELGVHTSECAVDAQARRQQLLVTGQDIEKMERILNATECGVASHGPVLVQLLQCHARRGEGTSFITFGHRVLRETADQLQSEFARHALQERLAPLYHQAEPSGQVFLEVDEAHRPRRRLQHHRARATWREPPRDLAPRLAVALRAHQPPTEATDEPLHVEKVQQKCSARQHPNCVLMRDKLMQTMTAIADKADEMKRGLGALDDKCESLRLNYEAQIADVQARFREAQTRLAEGTKVQNENDEQSRLKNIQSDDLNKDWQQTMSQCRSNIKQFEDEGCSVTKIRTEIYKVEGIEVHMQDCEVSSWTPDQCPVTCGGAAQRLSRAVVAQPSGGGAGCPPLEMMRRCNEQECPINCQLDDWTGWSSCTADCGGGVRQRTRIVNSEPRSGGDPCGETSESEVCNVQSCDVDCVLSDWTSWSQCSKACGAGLGERFRTVTTMAKGQGICPVASSEDRLEYRPCNNHPCVKAAGAETLRCTSKIDLVLLLDGSGSLGADAWSQLISSMDTFISALDGGANGVNLAVLLFSGPSSWNGFRRCTEGPRPGEEAPDLELDCKMQWLTRFTGDMAAARSAVSAAEWPQGQTLTSMALSTAETELPNGRRDAQSVVMVVTDGRPASPERTFQASKQLREKARLIWVPVTTTVSIEGMDKWASTPTHENVVQVPDFSTLALPETVSSLIADVCPVVG